MTLKRVVVIAATARTGSTLLTRGLGATGQFGDAREHFNPSRILERRQEWGVPRISMRGHAGSLRRRIQGDPRWAQVTRFTRRSVATYLDRLASEKTGPSGVLLCKTMWAQYEPVVLARDLDFGYWQVPVQWVRIRRVDRIRQAVSIEKARQTGQWEAAGVALGALTYDGPAIAASLAAITRDEAAWDNYLARLGVEPLTLTYEQLDGDYEDVMAKVLAYLGVTAGVPQRQLSRQADAINDDWVARFVAEQGHRG